MNRFIPRPVYHWSRTLHIYVSMLALLAILFFAFSGWIVNHPDWFDLKTPAISNRTATIPEEISGSSDKLEVVEYLRAKEQATGAVKAFNQTDDQTDIIFVKPGKTQQYSIARLSGETKITTEQYNRLTVLGDLHKAQYTGPWWSLVVDLSAWFLIFVSLTGLILWVMLIKRRTLGLIGLIAGSVSVVGVYFWLLP